MAGTVRKSHRFFTLLSGLFLLCCSSSLIAAEKAYVSLIIDDMGYKFKDDLRVIGLPGPVVCAIMPHGPNSTNLARLAHDNNKEVILHLPMQAMHNNENLGDGALTLDMEKDEFIRTLQNDFDQVPHAIGLNNHMGSLLTQHPGHMQWLMNAIKQNGFIYIDSLTSDHSIAARIAKENNIPYLIRDVFLDNKQNTSYVRQQFNELIKVAKHRGSAIGIGHPHGVTIDEMARFLIAAKQHNIEVVPIERLYQLRSQRK